MRRWFPIVPLWLYLAGVAWAVEGGSQTFTIIRAEQKTRDRVVYWVVNTPLYHADPYFEVEVRAGDVSLIALYESRRSSEIQPTDWKPGATVRGRVGRRNLYLQRPNGTELKFVILKRSHAPAERYFEES